MAETNVPWPRPSPGELFGSDVIVTSGIDGIYPKGFVIGKVVQVNNGNGIYKAIRLRPTVDYNSLEEVLIVKTPPPQSVIEERS